MKIRLKETPQQVELVKALGSKDRSISVPAQEAMAAFIADVAKKVLSQAGSANLIFTEMPYNEDDAPSIPLDLYVDSPTGFITTWSQSMAGGMPTSQVAGMQELKVSTYRLDSAVSLMKKYARRARLDVVSAAISRMLQEVLIKQERNCWSVLLRALGEASTNSLGHVIDATTNDVFQLDDLNRLMTRIKRINTSFDNGTPADFDAKGLTDIFVSPEVMQQIRSFSYEPMNTRVGTLTTSGATAVPLPDSIREEVYRNAGMSSIFGVNITELLELGDNGKYNVLFDTFYTGGETMVAGTDQIVVGVDLSRDACKKPIAANADTGSTAEVLPDDQFNVRADKVGWYVAVEEGAVVIDARALVGVIV